MIIYLLHVFVNIEKVCKTPRDGISDYAMAI